MAKVHGKGGAVYWAAAAGPTRYHLEFEQEWSATINVEIVEVTAMGDTWVANVRGFTDWTATAECLLDSAGSDIPLDPAGTPVGLGHGTAVNLELYMVYDTSTPLYAMLWGSAICSGLSLGTGAAGVATVTYKFEGVGEIAYYSDSSLKVYS